MVGTGWLQVADAVCAQMHTLNTNSRYLSSDLSEYVQELVATLPEPLQVGQAVSCMCSTD